eukprot:jgi/Psemu1/45752/gm1.45752_g
MGNFQTSGPSFIIRPSVSCLHFLRPRAKPRKQQRLQQNPTSAQTAIVLPFGPLCCISKLGHVNDLVKAVHKKETTASIRPGAARILGLALLWATFDAHAAALVPSDVWHQVTAKYIQLEAGLGDGGNPVKKVTIFAPDHEGCVNLDEIEDIMDDLMTWSGQQWRNSVYAKLSSNQVELGELMNFVIANQNQLSWQNKQSQGLFVT